MSESNNGDLWSILGLAGVLSICCIGTTALAGGAVLAGRSAAGVTAVSGTVGGLGELLVTGVVTALPLFVIGLFLRRRAQNA